MCVLAWLLGLLLIELHCGNVDGNVECRLETMCAKIIRTITARMVEVMTPQSLAMG